MPDALALVFLFAWPAAGAAAGVLGAALVVRRGVQRIREITVEAERWRDETYYMWEESCAEKTVVLPRIGGRGAPVVIEDQGLPGLAPTRAGRSRARHRLSERDTPGFRGELPAEEP